MIDIPLTIADLGDLDVIAAALALQRPLWAPGTRHGYHFFTIGWYESELLRRVDPAHRSLGRFFCEEIAGPLGIDSCIGCRPVSTSAGGPRSTAGAGLRHWGILASFPRSYVLAAMNPRSITYRAVANQVDLLFASLVTERRRRFGIGAPGPMMHALVLV